MFKRIDHVGVVVGDLEAATRLLQEGFGLEAGRSIDREDLEQTLAILTALGIETTAPRPPACCARASCRSCRSRAVSLANGTLGADPAAGATAGGRLRIGEFRSGVGDRL